METKKTLIIPIKQVHNKHNFETNDCGTHLRLQKNGLKCGQCVNELRTLSVSDKSVQVDGEPAREVKIIQGIVSKHREVTIIQLISDKANLCTFIGAILAVLAIANIWKKRYFLGLLLNTLASLADILDGPIARSSRDRHKSVSTVGKYLDTYSDVVSHFVVPASLLMNLSDLNLVCVVLSTLFVCTGILRHARMEIIGRCEKDTCAYGITSDYFVSTFAILMHMGPLLDKNYLVILFSCMMVFFIYSSLSTCFRSRRYSGFDLALVGLFHLWVSFSCFLLHYLCSIYFTDESIWRSDMHFWTNNEFVEVNFCTISAFILYFSHLILAYPCYFRFIERNS